MSTKEKEGFIYLIDKKLTPKVKFFFSLEGGIMAATFTCSGAHKSRLFIGDGNFSYTEAFIQKHDTKVGHNQQNSLAHSITSTELVAKIHCTMCDLFSDLEDLNISSTDKSSEKNPKPSSSCNDCSEIIKRIEDLKKMGVTVVLGVDATTISNDERFKTLKFSRIHWNCPHDGSEFKAQTLPPIIEKFFLECSKIQDPKGRIHMTLAQPNGKKSFYQGYVYDITRGARKAGYTLIKKRKFEMTRYPGYQHTQTKCKSKASVTDEGLREFVFEKADPNTFQKISETATEKTKEGKLVVKIKDRLEGLTKLSEKKCVINSDSFYDQHRFYYLCSSDEDSSDCDEKS
ncbi:MAG: DUF2431 domain-containing protein [Verrucomicrobia bacterium]|nr:DUF2431 domain-containing protein [Verrucomicrobiota bacterium]